MGQEDKQLLLENLTARLPYGVKVLQGGVVVEILHSICKVGVDEFVINPISYDMYNGFSIEEVKPYLRPLESMTEDEEIMFRELGLLNYENDGFEMANYKQIDWLNKNHFDYRGLIPKGLALKAPEDMYKNQKSE